LPFDREAASSYAHGLPPTEAPGDGGRAWRGRFAELAEKLRTFAEVTRHA